MKIIGWILWLFLIAITLAICLIAALALHEPIEPLMKTAILVGLAFVAADMLSAIRTPPWRRHKAPTLSDKTLILFGDGRVALANDPDHAQAIVMNECMTSSKMITADFRPATEDEVAALTKPDGSNQRHATHPI